MKLTRASFFRSLFLAPAAAIAAADRPAAGALAEAEEFQPAAAYKFRTAEKLSMRAIESIRKTWDDTWKGKGFDPPMLFILEDCADIDPLHSTVVTVNVKAPNSQVTVNGAPNSQEVAEVIVKQLRDMKVQI